MAIDANKKFLLNKWGSIGEKTQLGDLLANNVISAGQFTTAGGDADEVIPVSGMLATDAVFVSVETKGATPRTLVESKAAANQIEVELSGDPSTDHVLSYMVVRSV